MITKKEATELHDRGKEALKILQSMRGENCLRVGKICTELEVKVRKAKQFLTAYTADVGDGVTCGIMTDTYPYTVIEVHRLGKELVVQADTITHIPAQSSPGQPGKPTQKFLRNRRGEKRTITLRSDGQYREKGQDSRRSSGYWIIGERKHYINRDN